MLIAKSSGTQAAGSVTLHDESAATTTGGTAEARPLRLKGWSATQDDAVNPIVCELLDGTGGPVLAKVSFEKTGVGPLTQTTFIPAEGNVEENFIEVSSGKLVAKFVGAGKGTLIAYIDQQ